MEEALTKGIVDGLVGTAWQSDPDVGWQAMGEFSTAPSPGGLWLSARTLACCLSQE